MQATATTELFDDELAHFVQLGIASARVLELLKARLSALHAALQEDLDGGSQVQLKENFCYKSIVPFG